MLSKQTKNKEKSETPIFLNYVILIAFYALVVSHIGIIK